MHPTPTRRYRLLLALLLAAFLTVNLVNAINKGGDFDVYVDAAGRLLAGADPYEDSTITVGFVGPPAQALPFVPFVPIALLDGRAARVAWYGVNLLLLWYAVTTWARLLAEGRRTGDGPVWASRDSLLALAAVAYPLQTQFEHQNINLLLLAFSAAAAEALRQGRAAAGGAALGVAAALKVYPGLALVWLAGRRSWRSLAAALLAAGAFTAAPAALRGGAAFLEDIATWREIAGAGWPARRANQSLVAMWGRYVLGEAGADYPIVTPEAGLVLACSAATAAVLLALVLAATVARGRSGSGAPERLACINAAASLVSPIAWEHYWVAWFPVMMALRLRSRESRLARVSFWLGALLISGLSRPFVGAEGAALVRELSVMTWGGLLTCVAVAVLLWREGGLPAERDAGPRR